VTALIQMRRDTAANWTSATPTLAAGEWGFETDTGNVKIGTGALWNATPYLTSIPTKAPTLDFDTMNVFGRYRITSALTGLSNGPSGDIALVDNDGAADLLVITFGSAVVQALWTEGDGTLQQKSFFRVYDADSSAWRAWTPMNSWAESASSGVNLVAKSITTKDDATVEGDLVVNGSATLGDAAGDHVVVQADGATPVIYPSGDTNTGVSFPIADQIALVAAGVDRAVFGPNSVAVSAAINAFIDLTVSGTGNVRMNGGPLNMNSQRIINIAAPTSNLDVASLGNTFNRIEAAFWNAAATASPTSTLASGTWTQSGKGTNSITIDIGASPESYYAIGFGFDSGNGGLQGVGIISSGRTLTVASANNMQLLFAVAFKISA